MIGYYFVMCFNSSSICLIVGSVLFRFAGNMVGTAGQTTSAMGSDALRTDPVAYYGSSYIVWLAKYKIVLP